jgi:hypothetical protein
VAWFAGAAGVRGDNLWGSAVWGGTVQPGPKRVLGPGRNTNKLGMAFIIYKMIGERGELDRQGL